MAITDTITSVSTTWAEKPAVDWLAGTLPTVTELVAEVQTRIQRGTLGAGTTPSTTQVQTWLIMAKQELMAAKGFTFARRYASGSLVAGTYVYAMPPDYNGGPLRILNVTSDFDRDIPWIPPSRFDLSYPLPSETSSGEPAVCTVKNNELWLWPPPDAAYTVEVQYSRNGSSNTATDFSFLPELERWRCCDYATYRAFAVLKEGDMAGMYKGLWDSGLAISIRSDSRKKWPRGTSAISIFQEFALGGRALDPET